MTEIETAIRNSIAIIRNHPDDYTTGQDTWLQIEQDGDIYLETQHKDINSVTMHLYHGLAQVLPLPSGVMPGAVADWLEEGDRIELLEKLVEGFSTRWDGSNRVGELTDEAANIKNTLSFQLLNHEGEHPFMAQVVDEVEASDWLNPIDDQFQRASTAEEAEQIAAEAVENGEVMESMDGNGGKMRVDLEDAKTYARNVWEENSKAKAAAGAVWDDSDDEE